ncbi:hypothetical protein ACFPES_03265 [Paenibacillus sp. GCM10023248]|uniref:hypothetical protein n=1 Tax=unclassified Paenibacillus TaxID=185978 RepID=UPI002377E7FD|nr:hypothetical protein [Paenibacillus sp. MAHUQ-63]MDD9266045.1 hypothetical protein [Paenibacillus sp. MAHUQ-63]
MAYTKTTYIDRAVQWAKRFFMNWDGGSDKNLLPPFSDWTLHANAVVTSPYVLTLNSTGTWQQSYIEVPVLPSTSYAFSCTLAGSNAGHFYILYNSAGAQTFSSSSSTASSITFTTQSDTAKIRIIVTSASGASTGAIIFTNPQLELGSAATAFAPKKLYTITQSPGTVTQAGTPLNAANLNKMEQGIYDAHVTADGALQRTGGTMTGLLRNTTNSPLVSKMSGYKSWIIHHPSANSFIFAPSATVDGEDWDWPKNIIFNENGTIQAGQNSVWDTGKLRVHSSGTYIEWFNGSIWQGVGGLKSIQRGVVGASGTSATDVTISAVNMAKTVISLDAFGPMRASDTIIPASIYATLISSTTLRFVGDSGINTVPVAWQVIEYY